MAALTPGSITSTTVEGALLEILQLIAGLQNSDTNNLQNRTVITSFTQNSLTGTYTATIALPATVTMGPDGIVTNAREMFS